MRTSVFILSEVGDKDSRMHLGVRDCQDVTTCEEQEDPRAHQALTWGGGGTAPLSRPERTLRGKMRSPSRPYSFPTLCVTPERWMGSLCGATLSLVSSPLPALPPEAAP